MGGSNLTCILWLRSKWHDFAWRYNALHCAISPQIIYSQLQFFTTTAILLPRSGAFHYAASLCITLHDAPSHDMPWHCIDKILHAPVVRSIAFERIARCSVVNHRDFECTAQLSMAVWRIAFHEGKIWPDTASYYIYIHRLLSCLTCTYIYTVYIYGWNTGLQYKAFLRNPYLALDLNFIGLHSMTLHGTTLKATCSASRRIHSIALHGSALHSTG